MRSLPALVFTDPLSRNDLAVGTRANKAGAKGPLKGRAYMIHKSRTVAGSFRAFTRVRIINSSCTLLPYGGLRFGYGIVWEILPRQAWSRSRLWKPFVHGGFGAFHRRHALD